MQYLSTWPPSFNQNSDNLSEDRFFIRVTYFYKTKIPLLKKNIFSKSLLIQICLCYRNKMQHHLFPMRCSSKGWKITDSVWRYHARWSLKCVYILHMKGPASHYNVLLKQTDVQRVWFDKIFPTSYTIIPCKNSSEHVLTCLP